mmetsp:Transcript_11801/g.24379  ORF Transcript_11801/g.24379 Transcript_11801/m.24379 type:complete len:283 (+) Transcript_11801:1120-1968(+)
MENFLADAVQKVLIVGYHKEGLLPGLQVIVEPNDGIEIKMVCRFVQHQKRWFDKEGTSQRNSHSPTSRKHLGRFGLHFRGKSETRQDSVGLSLCGIRSHVGQFLHNNTEAIDGFVTLVTGIDLGHQFLFLLDEAPSNLVSLEDGFHSGSIVCHDLLFDVQKVDAGRKNQIAGGNHLEESRLTPTVGTNQTVSASVGNVQGRILKQYFSGSGNRKVGNVNVQRILPLGILCVDSRLTASKLSTLLTGLGGDLFVFGGTCGGLSFLDQSLSLLVTEFLSVLSVQ